LGAPVGIAVWSTPGWVAGATAWIDERLSLRGVRRTGGVEQPHLRPWATLLRTSTTAGTVWLKAAAPGTASEVGVYTVLSRAAPEATLVPLAIDPARGWVLLPDGGATLDRDADLGPAMAAYGRLQRALEPTVGELLDAGVEDHRPAMMPRRLEQALAVIAAVPGGGELAERVAARRPQLLDWFARLAEAPGAPSLDHNDLHHRHVLGGGTKSWRFYDWGDAVVAHPFAVARLPLSMAGDERAVRDAYLAAFADLAPHAALVETLELACRVSKVTRILVWDRALMTAREAGVEVPDDWVDAPLHIAASVLDDGHLGAY
jgi:Phosphotransferase enzyme family